MTRSEFVDELFEKDPYLFSNNKSQADKAVDLVFNMIRQSLIEGNRVELRGFGVFETKVQKARVGRNPKNGDSVDVPNKTMPHYKMSRELYKYLNSEKVQIKKMNKNHVKKMNENHEKYNASYELNKITFTI